MQLSCPGHRYGPGNSIFVQNCGVPRLTFSYATARNWFSMAPFSANQTEQLLKQTLRYQDRR